MTSSELPVLEAVEVAFPAHLFFFMVFENWSISYCTLLANFLPMSIILSRIAKEKLLLVQATPTKVSDCFKSQHLKCIWHHAVHFSWESNVTMTAGSGCFNEATARPADMTSKSIKKQLPFIISFQIITMFVTLQSGFF